MKKTSEELRALNHWDLENGIHEQIADEVALLEDALEYIALYPPVIIRQDTTRAFLISWVEAMRDKARESLAKLETTK